MNTDLALQYRKARETLIRLNPIDADAWKVALREPQPFRSYVEHGLMISGSFLGHVSIVSLDGQPYIQYRSLQVRPQRRDVYGMTADGRIEYAGNMLSNEIWQRYDELDRDAAYHRGRRRRA